MPDSAARSLYALLRRLRPALWGDAAARDDVLHDAWLRHQDRPDAPLERLAHDAARTENRRFARAERRFAALPDDLPRDQTDEVERVDRAQRRAMLDEIVASLPPVDRELYVLVAREHLSIRAAAERMRRTRSWTDENYRRVRSRVETLLCVRVGRAARRGEP